MQSNEELKAIKQFYPQGKFFNGSAATLKAFGENSGNASIIHLATHASPGNDSIPARIELYDSSMYINSIYAKKLKASGVPEQQAEVHAEALAGVIEEQLATKRDLSGIRRYLKVMEMRIIIKLGAMIAASIAITVTLLKVF